MYTIVMPSTQPRTRQPSRVPDAAEIAEVIGLMPLISAFFRRARTDMPDTLLASYTDHRLGPRHGAVLVQLLADDAISVTEIAERLGSSLSTTSGLVGDLERAGWVVRREDPANRRRTLVSLPAERRGDVAGFVSVRSAPVLRALEQLTPGERAGFVRGLRLWVHEARDGD
jgi:DNA-binding MarR family transcriptional regulator